MDWSLVAGLGAVGFVVGYVIAVSAVMEPVRRPLTVTATNTAETAAVMFDASTFWPAAVGWWVLSTLAGLLAYALSCRRCVGIEAVLVWAAVSGWPGFVPVAAGCALHLLATTVDERLTA